MADFIIKGDTKLDTSGFQSGLSSMGSAATAAFDVAAKAAMAVTAAVTAIGVASIAVGKEFETSFAKASTLFGDTAVDVANLKDEILDISTATGMAATEINEALYSALSAGVKVTEDMAGATDFLEGSAKLAIAGFTDIDTAVAATAKTLNAYGLGVEHAEEIQKMLIQTQNLGITTVGELGASLAQVTPTAAAFAVGFDQVSAALADVTASGTPTATATAQLNGLFAELGKSGTIASNAMLEVYAGTDNTGKSFKQLMEEGMTLDVILQDMAAAAEANGMSLVDMFGSIDAGKAALVIAEGENFASNLEAMATEADVVGAAYETMANTFENQSARAIEGVKNLGIMLYEGVLKDSATGALSVANDYISYLTMGFQDGGIEGLIDEGISILFLMTKGMLEAVPGFMETGTQIMLDMAESMANGTFGFGDTGMNILGELMDAIVAGFPAFFEAGMTLLGQVAVGIMDAIPGLLDMGLQALSGLLDYIDANMPAMLDKGMELLNNLVAGISAALPGLVQKAVEMLTTLLFWIAQNLPEVVRMGLDIVGSLIQGLLNALPGLLAQAPELIFTIIKGLGEAMGELLTFALEMWWSIQETMASIDWIQLGIDLIAGVGKGIVDGAGAVVDAAKNAAQAAFNAAKEFLGIKSPSRLMRDEIGKMYSQGFAVGIEEDSSVVVAASEGVAAKAVKAAEEELANISAEVTTGVGYGDTTNVTTSSTSVQQNFYTPPVSAYDAYRLAWE